MSKYKITGIIYMHIGMWREKESCRKREREREGGRQLERKRDRGDSTAMVQPLHHHTCWNCGEEMVLRSSASVFGSSSPSGRYGISRSCTSALARMGSMASGFKALARSTPVRNRINRSSTHSQPPRSYEGSTKTKTMKIWLTACGAHQVTLKRMG